MTTSTALDGATTTTAAAAEAADTIVDRDLSGADAATSHPHQRMTF
jgi:hypothetical protein